jgi:hypothetical protein
MRPALGCVCSWTADGNINFLEPKSLICIFMESEE